MQAGKEKNGDYWPMLKEREWEKNFSAGMNMTLNFLMELFGACTRVYQIT
jgi:hypothetical protein